MVASSPNSFVIQKNALNLLNLFICAITKRNPDNQQEINELEEKYQKAPQKQLIQNIDVSKMKKLLSYSLRHYLFQIQGTNENDEDASKQLVTLLNKLAAKLQWRTLPNKFHFLALFFLTLGSQSVAFHLLAAIYDLLPLYSIEFMNDPIGNKPKLSSQNQRDKLASFLNYLIKNYQYSDSQQRQLQIFIQFIGMELLSSFFIDMLSVECTFISIDLMVTSRTFLEVERLFMMLIRFHHDFIMSCDPSQQDEYSPILVHLIRNTDFSEISQKCNGESNFLIHKSEQKIMKSKLYFFPRMIENLLSQTEEPLKIQKSNSSGGKQTALPLMIDNYKSNQEETLNEQEKIKISEAKETKDTQNSNEAQQSEQINQEDKKNIEIQDQQLSSTQQPQEILHHNNEQIHSKIIESPSLTPKKQAQTKDEVLDQQLQNFNLKEEQQKQIKLEEIKQSHEVKVNSYEQEISALKEQVKIITAERDQDRTEKDLLKVEKSKQEQDLKKFREDETLYNSIIGVCQHEHNKLALDKLWKELQSLQISKSVREEERVVSQQQFLLDRQEIKQKQIDQKIEWISKIEEAKVNEEQRSKILMIEKEQIVSQLEEQRKKYTILESEFNISKNQLTELEGKYETIVKEKEQYLRDGDKWREVIAKTDALQELEIQKLKLNLEDMKTLNDRIRQQMNISVEQEKERGEMIQEELVMSLQEKEEEVGKLTEEVRLLKEELEKLKRQISEHEKSESMLNLQNQEYQIENSTMKKELQEKNPLIESYEDQQKQQNETITQNDFEIKRLTDQLSEKEEELEKTKIQNMEKFAANLSEIETLKSKVIILKEKEEEAQKISKQNQSQWESNEQQIKTQQEKIEQLQSEMLIITNELSLQKQMISDSEKKLLDQQTSCLEHDKLIEQLKKQIEDLTISLEEKQEELNKYLFIFNSVKKTVTEAENSK